LAYTAASGVITLPSLRRLIQYANRTIRLFGFSTVESRITPPRFFNAPLGAPSVIESVASAFSSRLGAAPPADAGAPPRPALRRRRQCASAAAGQTTSSRTASLAHRCK